MAADLKPSQRVSLLVDRLQTFLHPEERELLLWLRQRSLRIEQAVGKFKAEPRVDGAGTPFLEVSWADDALLVTPNEARQLAGVLFDSATLADVLAFLHRYETMVEGKTGEEAAVITRRFRQFLAKDPTAFAATPTIT